MGRVTKPSRAIVDWLFTHRRRGRPSAQRESELDALLRDYNASFRGCSDPWGSRDDELVEDAENTFADDSGLRPDETLLQDAAAYEQAKVERQMSFDSDLTKVIRRAEAQGFRHALTSSGHHQFFPPNGGRIITTGGTPGHDNRAWNNFMADLRRVGYQEDEATTSLGEKLSEAMAAQSNGNGVSEAHDAPGPMQIILGALDRHPGGLSLGDLVAIVRSQRPGYPDHGVSGTLSYLKRIGRVESPGRAWWKLAPPQQQAHPTPLPPPLPRAADLAPPATKPVDVTGSSLEQDLLKIDEALAALAKLEGGVKEAVTKALDPALEAIAVIADAVGRARDAIRQVHALREHLEKFKL